MATQILVNIGANNGLPHVCFQATADLSTTEPLRTNFELKYKHFHVTKCMKMHLPNVGHFVRTLFC